MNRWKQTVKTVQNDETCLLLAKASKTGDRAARLALRDRIQDMGVYLPNIAYLEMAESMVFLAVAK